MNRFPDSIKWAFWCLAGSLTLYVPSVALNISATPEEYSRPLMIAVSLVFPLLMIWFGYELFTGRNWARLLYTVLIVAGTVLMLRAPAQNVFHPAVRYIGWVQNLLQGLALIFLYRRDANLWYRRRGGRR